MQTAVLHHLRQISASPPHLNFSSSLPKALLPLAVLTPPIHSLSAALLRRRLLCFKPPDISSPVYRSHGRRRPGKFALPVFFLPASMCKAPPRRSNFFDHTQRFIINATRFVPVATVDENHLADHSMSSSMSIPLRTPTPALLPPIPCSALLCARTVTS
jgi:hypothetical protein